MSDVPSDLRYAKSHEWVRVVEHGVFEVGISEHALSALGDLVSVAVPRVGRTLSAGEACAVVESSKAASDVYSPIAGTVISANAELASEPELANHDPYGKGWIFRLRGEAPLAESLMSAADYEKYLAEQA